MSDAAELPPVPATASVCTVAGGCFWGIEDAFSHAPGIISVTSGYCNGTVDAPTYRQVCTGTTGHAEAVRIVFDPKRISYGQLLDLFWNLHDPTTLDRQGPDVGSQYRSAIFTHDATQARQATLSKLAAQIHFPRPIVTVIEPAARFWPAEDYHQQYFAKNGQSGCHVPRKGWPIVTERLELSDAEWRLRLTPDRYRILRQAGTEAPYCSAYEEAKSHGAGVYACAGCGLELYESTAKFESGSGWPSFFRGILGRISEHRDASHGMERVEIRCARCDGHLGHVFEDGPKPTGRRHCVNGLSLEFRPASK